MTPHDKQAAVRRFEEHAREAAELRRYATEIISSSCPVFALAKATIDELKSLPEADRPLHIIGLLAMLTIISDAP